RRETPPRRASLGPRGGSQGHRPRALTLLLAHKQRVLESVLLAQPGNAVGLEFEPVASSQLPELRRVEIRGLQHRPQLVKEVLEAPWRDDLQDPTGLVAGVPERVPLVAGLECQVPDL